jgi:hypothetical protein
MAGFALPGLCFAWFLAIGSLAQEAPALPNAGAEIIVKFRSQTNAGEMTVRAAARGDGSSEELSRYVAAVGRELGVPLDVKRMGSGGTVRIALRNSELTGVLVSKLQQQRSVKSARRVTESDGSDIAAVRVEFVPGSAEATALANAPRSDSDRRAAADAMAVKLSRVAGLAMSGRIDQHGQLFVTPSLRELTTQIASRLAKRPDVEYAQPNVLMRQDGGIR